MFVLISLYSQILYDFIQQRLHFKLLKAVSFKKKRSFYFAVNLYLLIAFTSTSSFSTMHCMVFWLYFFSKVVAVLDSSIFCTPISNCCCLFYLPFSISNLITLPLLSNYRAYYISSIKLIYISVKQTSGNSVSPSPLLPPAKCALALKPLNGKYQ